MNKQRKRSLWMAAGLLMAFVLWTAAVCTMDVQPIGPEGSSVGLAKLNGTFHRLTGVHMTLYDLTDQLSILSLGLVAGFGLLGLWQWVQRKHLCKVDRSLLALGGFYILVLAAFVGFEFAAVNYRPILIEGQLEASYPSSTTMLSLCVLPTAAMQFKARGLGRGVSAALYALTVFMVVARMISGVHWLTDILGGMLLSGGLVMLYRAAVEK